MAVQYANGKIVTNGLILALDGADRNSYSGSGTSWTDLSGNGNNGTLTNGPTFNSGNGGSLIFDGVDDSIIVQDSTSLATNNNNISVFLWINQSSATPSNQQTIIVKNNIRNISGTNYADGWRIAINTSQFLRFQAFANTSTSGVFNAIGGTIIPNTWQYVGFTLGNTYGINYINGVQTAIGNVGVVPTINTPSPLSIGYETNLGGTFKFPGKVSLSQVYNRELSVQEVLQNYNAQKARFNLN